MGPSSKVPGGRPVTSEGQEKEDDLYWQKQDRKVLERIDQLIRDYQRKPFAGIGKPEPLKHVFAGYFGVAPTAKSIGRAMPLYFFTIPALDPLPAQEELNRFCAGQRVVSIDRQFVEAGINSYWSLCVCVATGPEPLPDALKAPESRGRAGREAGGDRVDYKEDSKGPRGYHPPRDAGRYEKRCPASCAAAPSKRTGTTTPGGRARPTATRGTRATATTTRVSASP